MRRTTLSLGAALLGVAASAAAQDDPDAGFPVDPTPFPTPAHPDALLPGEADSNVFEADFGVTVAPFERASEGELLPDPGIAPDDLLGVRIDSLLFDATAEPGHVYVRGGHWKALFGPDGLTYVPRLGLRAERNQPTSFALRGASLGGQPLVLDRAAVGTDETSTVSIEHGALREVYHLDMQTVEQTFVFDRLPGEGDLVVDVAVDSSWPVVPGEDAIRFVSPEYGEVTYGRAYAYDATGATIEIAREWTGAGIELRVPASFVAGATLPLTIDPPIGSVITNSAGGPDDFDPDVAYDANSLSFWMAYADYSSATDYDCILVQFSNTGSQGATILIDVSGMHYAAPAIAAAPAANRLLVVSAATPNPGLVNSDIVGRLIDSDTFLPASPPFVIDTTSFDCSAPDVGGTWSISGGFDEFCVVWQRSITPTSNDIHARLVDANGPLDSPTIFLANTTNNDIAPSVSPSWGDPAATGDFWNVAWIRDNVNFDGLGAPMVNRIYLNGTPNGSMEYRAYATDLASNISVTSTFDDSLANGSGRPFLVAFQRAVNNNDIYVSVCQQNNVAGASDVSVMEDFDQSLPQIEPSIATDGRNFMLTYAELSYSTMGSTNYDVYMNSGGISEAGPSAFVALAERHEDLGSSGFAERRPHLASRYDGDGGSDDGLVAWMQDTFGPGGTLRLRFVDIDTLDGSQYQSVGRQYCDANANGDSGAGGRESSWLRILGNRRVSSQHRLQCEDMTRNSWGFFLCSRTLGNTNHPGGSAGRICVAGTVGRAVAGFVGNSSTSGSISTYFDPLVLPTPTGTTSAIPGQTWYFQTWHRDYAGPLSTSNFSNACSITWRP